MGLATTPFYGGMMSGSDQPSAGRYDLPAGQRFTVRNLLKLSDNLREFVAKKVSLPSRPSKASLPVPAVNRLSPASPVGIIELLAVWRMVISSGIRAIRAIW